MVGQKGMNGVTTFMHHGGYIAHLPCRIHENKRSAGFRKRTIITTRSLAFPAIQVQPSHLFHPDEAFREERVELPEAFNGFVDQLISGVKRSEGSDTFGFG